MLASFSQFVREAGSGLPQTISQRFTSAPQQPPKSQPETDIASQTTSVTDHDPDVQSPPPDTDAKERRRRKDKSQTVYEVSSGHLSPSRPNELITR